MGEVPQITNFRRFLSPSRFGHTPFRTTKHGVHKGILPYFGNRCLFSVTFPKRIRRKQPHSGRVFCKLCNFQLLLKRETIPFTTIRPNHPALCIMNKKTVEFSTYQPNVSGMPRCSPFAASFPCFSAAILPLPH